MIAPSYAFGAWLFVRLLGLAYFFAFGSLAIQVRGLIGRDGILPAEQFLGGMRDAAARGGIGAARFAELPTFFWLNASDGALVAACTGGLVLAALLVARIAPAVILPLLWIDYLSLSVVSREFLTFQWDALLLEAGLLAVLLVPLTGVHRFANSEPRTVARWLVWWLLFRLMLGSGIVKLSSGDSAWASLTALAFHYETQPIPTPLAWYAHNLPAWFHNASTAAVLSVELFVPWMIFAPRLRLAACATFIGLQVAIALTGNYAFFNVLTIALALTLVDDAVWIRTGIVRPSGAPAKQPRRWPKSIVAAAAIVLVPVSLAMLLAQVGIRMPGIALIAPVYGVLAPFRSVNAYGLFAVMTTTRPEIVLEGSYDGITWKPYEFKYKPGDLLRPPPWVAPYHPRLDWHMWFLALGEDEREEWFENLSRRLIEGSQAVTGLLGNNPFRDSPPRLVRAVRYMYRFADPAARRRDGVWWVRELRSPAVPSAREPGPGRQ
jgi:hypothetical protein